MALNLSRNSRVFITTNCSASGILNTTAASFTTANTFELQVLDGFTFSQNSNSETVTLNEAGASPTRGQRSFNTSLAPVDFSFSTYVRPEKYTNVTCEEAVLWKTIATTTGTGWTEAVGSAALSLANSNANQLQKFCLFVLIDNVTYLIENCAMNQVTLDFGLDQIATLQWTGFGGRLVQFSTSITTGAITNANTATATQSFSAGAVTNGSGTSVTLSGGGASFPKMTAADFITNKLTTATIQGYSPVIAQVSLPITGGNLTFNNNITFLTPANIGVVNTPITYFTGTRSITGSLTAYLRTGGSDAGTILSTMLNNTGIVEPNFKIEVQVGGSGSTVRMDLVMPTCSLQVPTLDVQQVVSTSLNFTAQPSAAGTGGSAFDLSGSNELSVTYYAA